MNGKIEVEGTKKGAIITLGADSFGLTPKQTRSLYGALGNAVKKLN